VNGIEARQEVRVKREGVSLDECQGIIRLPIDVNPDDIEPGLAVPYSRAASTAE
jgi:hypothetical protein